MVSYRNTPESPRLPLPLATHALGRSRDVIEDASSSDGADPGGIGGAGLDIEARQRGSVEHEARRVEQRKASESIAVSRAAWVARGHDEPATFKTPGEGPSRAAMQPRGPLSGFSDAFEGAGQAAEFLTPWKLTVIVAGLIVCGGLFGSALYLAGKWCVDRLF